MVSDLTSFSTTEPTIKMRTSINNISTFYNKYENGVKEYVFTVKKRPFGMVKSPSLPVPSTSYIDFSLVDKLALPITDVQYKKITYCGHKMRIVGKVSITVQCIRNGATADNVHIRAFVILNLLDNLDADSIAGSKMASRLGDDDDDTFPGKFPMATGSSCQLSSIHEAAGDGTTTPPAAKDATTTPPAARDATTAPPTARDSTTTPPAADGRDDAQREGVRGHDDAQHEGVRGREDAQHEEVQGCNEVHPEVVGGQNEVQSERVGGPDDARGPPDTHADLVAKSEARESVPGHVTTLTSIQTYNIMSDTLLTLPVYPLMLPTSPCWMVCSVRPT